jgi:hypothetical protein
MVTDYCSRQTLLDDVSRSRPIGWEPIQSTAGHIAMSHMATSHTVIRTLFVNRLAKTENAIRANPAETLTGHGH